MSKINLNSRVWKNSAGGRLELLDLKVDQSVVIGASVVFTDILANGDVTIGGDLTVQGTMTSISTDIIEMQDNIILINAEETGAGVTPNLSGLEVERGTLTNQRLVFQESDDNWRIGEVGSTQALATREDAPLVNGIMTWNSTETRLDSVNDIVIDILYSGSNATDINTGAIHTTGGIGVVQDVHIGGTIYLQGTSPNNSTIDSDAANNLILTSIEDISLVPSAGKDVNIPVNIGLTFGSDLYKIESNGVDLTLNSNSDINLTPVDNINIPDNKLLTFGSDNRNINSDATNLNINSDNNINLNSTGNNIVIDSNTGTATLDGHTGVTVQSATGNVTLDGNTGINLQGNAAEIDLTTTGDIDMNSGGVISLDTTDTINGIKLGTEYSGVPISIGHTVSETTVNDNLTVLGALGLLGTTTFDGKVIIDITNTESFLIRKDGDSGDVLTVDTTNSFTLLQNPSAPTNSNVLYLYNPSKTVNNTVSMFWDLDESTDTRTSYIELQGQIKTNTTTAEDGALHINISTNGSLDTYMTFDGELNLVQTEVPSVIDITNTEAFLVRKNSDSGDLFTIDTTNETVKADARLLIDRTDTEALLIRKNSDSGDILTVDTSGEIITANSQVIIDDTNTEAFLVRVNSDSEDVFTVNTTDKIVDIGDGSSVSNSGILSLYGPNSSSSGPNLVTTTDEDIYPNIQLYTYSHDNLALSFDSYYDGAWKSSDIGSNFQISKVSDELVINTETGIAQGAAITWDTSIRINNTGIVTFEKNVILDSDSSEALLVRKNSDSGDQFIVDTTNDRTIALNTFRIGAVSDGIDFLFDGVDTLDISAVNATDKININSSISVLEIVNNLDVDGHTFLDRTTILTNDGIFQVSGSNSFDFDVAAASRIVTSTGNLTLDAESGTLVLDGSTSVTIDSAGSISIDGSAGSNFSTSSGILTLNGAAGINIQGNASEIDLTTTGAIDLNSGGLLSIDTTNTGSGITIGTSTSGVPISIGHTVSETTVNDNFNVIGVTSLQDCLIIDVTKSEGLLVRKNSDSGDVFIVDTTNSRVGINKTPTTTFDVLGNSLFDGTVTIDHDSTVALLVRKDSVGDSIFSVDTSGAGITNVLNGHFAIKNVKFESSNDNLDISANTATIKLIPTDSSTTGNLEINTTTLKYYNDTPQVVFQLNTDSTVTPNLTGKGVRFTPITIEDNVTAASGTATEIAFHSIEAPTLTATNTTVTTTDAATLYLSGSPIAGTNQTITNSYSLLVNDNAKFNNDIFVVGVSNLDKILIDIDDAEALLIRKNNDSGDMLTVNTVSETITADAKVLIDRTDTEALLVRKDSDGGDVFTINTSANVIATNSVNFRIQGNITGTPNTTGAYLSYLTTTFTDNNTAGSGTAAAMVFNSIAAPTLAASNTGVTTTDAASLYIADSPIAGTNQTITNSYSLWVDAGTTRFDGTHIQESNMIIDTDSTEALLIRKDNDSGDIFWVDTTNERTHFGDSNFYATFDGTDSFIHFATSNDYLRYNRTDNTFHFTIASIDRFTVDNSTIISEVKHYVDSTNSEAFLVRKDGDSGDVFTVDTTGNAVTVTSSSFDVSGAISGTPSNTGQYLALNASTFTDNNTAASGTAAIAVFNSIAAPTLAATNTSVTTTDAATMYIAGAPIAGTNETITNSYALWVGSGEVRIDSTLNLDTLVIDNTSTEAFLVRKDNDSGDVFVVDTTNSNVEIFSGNNLIVSDTTASTSSSSGALQIAGGFGAGNDSFIEDGNLTIHDTDTFAFLVEDTTGNDIFRVNTTNAEVTLNAATFVSHNLRVGSSQTGTPGTTGPYLNILGSTFTDNDTAAAGTAALMNFHSIAAPTLAATNGGVTTTLANTMYIAGAPVTGTNETITEKYALYVASDNVRFTGDLFVDGAITATASLTDTITLDYNSTETLLIRKDSDGGDVFSVDTVNETVTFAKDTNNIGDRVKTIYRLYNSLSSPTVFGKIDMEIDTPTSGNETGSFYFSAIKNGSMKDYIVINGNDDTIDLPSNVSLIFGDTAENIVGDGTALSINSSEDIYLTATSKVNIPANVNLTFGDDAENIVGDGTDLTINSSNKVNVIGVTLDADISGSADIVAGANSNFTATAGNITIDSEAGNLVLDGHNTVTIDSDNGGISIDAAGTSNFTTTTGTMTLQGIGINIEGGTGEIDVNTTGAVDISSGGAVTIDTTDTGSGITIGTETSGVPITIGHSVSEVVIGDNLTVNGDFTVSGTTTTLDTQTLIIDDNLILTNAAPSGVSDAGVLGKRYQPQNDSSLGEVVADTAEETGTAQAGTATTITLAAGANAADDYYNGWWIKLTGGTGSGQCRQIKDYVGSTKVATIYDTADETGDAQTPSRGADFTTNPDATSVYSLHGGTYAGTFFDESLDEWAICYTATSPGDGSADIIKYVDLHVNSLLTETALGVTGLLIDNNNTEAILVRKDGDAGDIFVIDSVNNHVTSYVDFQIFNGDGGNVLFEVLDGSNDPVVTIGNSTSSTSDIRFNGAAGATQSIYFNNGSDLGKIEYSHSSHTFNFIANSSSRLLIDDTSIESEGPFIIDSTNAEAFLVRKDSDSGDLFVVDTSSNMVTIADGCLDINGARSGTPSLVGHYLCVSSSTFTDNNTAASGTATAIAFHGFATPTLAATNASVTTTDAATLYIEGCPLEGTNQTITNCYALWIDSGNFRIDGDIIVSGSVDGRDVSADGSNLDNLYTTIGLSALTSAEVDQLENINSVTISNTQWGYLGGLDQALSTASNVSFNQVIVDGTSIESFLVRKNTDGGDVFTVDTTGDIVTSNAQVIIDHTSTEALLVRKNSDGGDVFTVDTTNDEVDITGKLTVVGSGSIAGSDLNNSTILVGTSSTGIGLDINELYCNGNNFVIGTISSNYISIRPAATEVLRISSDSVSSEQKVVIDVTDTEAFLVRKNSDGGDIFTVNTIDATVLLPSSRMSIFGNRTAAPNIGGGWLRLINGGYTFTDDTTAASGTATAHNAMGIGQMTLAASNSSVTTTDSASLYIAGAPIAGTNQTITNAYSLWVDSGTVKLDGDLIVDGTITSGISSPSITVSSSNLVNIAAAGNVTAQYVKLVKNGTNRTLWISFDITPTSGGLETSFRFTVPELTTITNKYDITGTIQGYLDSDDTNLENKVVVAVPTDDNCKIKFTSINNTTHSIQIQINYNSN